MSSSDSFVVYTPDTKSEVDDLASQDGFSTSLASKAPTLVSSKDLSVDMHELEGENGAVLISTHTPRIPDNNSDHVPCDIVLVIDVSGSMGAPAPLPDAPDGNARERDTGLSVLSLVQHAARTILETMNEGDRLGIVTFEDKAEVVQKLRSMDEDSKKKARANISKLRPLRSTNLWAGIRAGLDLFKDDGDNVQGMYILTDGMPNYMCPPQGYVPKLKPILEEMGKRRNCVPSIHTFGFGYSIRSGLMQSIAETGGGNYAFIPDAGMIGTVFVHAVANLFSTYAVSAKLTLETLHDTKVQYNAGIPFVSNEWGDITLDLGNLQYGQSREIVVYIGGAKSKGSSFNAKLACRLPNGTVKATKSSIILGAENSTLPPALVHYHLFRNKLTTLLASLFPTRADGEHVPITQSGSVDKALEDHRASLTQLSEQIRFSPLASDPDIKSISEDINGADPAGQILLALGGQGHSSYWEKWGRHYLPSLLHAHMRQICNTFKDPGPLRYGADSPLFLKCRNELDAMFDSLPPPEPTLSAHGGMPPRKFVGSMSKFNSSSNPCFDGNSLVQCGDGSYERVKNLRPGTEVWTPAGGRAIRAILRTIVRESSDIICRIGNLWVTPWHPIMHKGVWKFPANVAEEVKLCCGSVFSVLLDRSENADAHAINVDGQICTTLGHGIVEATSGQRDVRAHAFFGDYEQVERSLLRLSKDQFGHLLGGGVTRSSETGLVCGFVNMSLESMSASSAKGDSRERESIVA